MNKQPFYLTTTLPYVNAELHMGHALEFVRADIIARYKMLAGFDVFFNTGTDEHGLKIFEKAKEAGLSPQVFVDGYVEKFKESVKSFGVSGQIHFIRTTDAYHILAAQAFWERVSKNGFIYKKFYEAKYCIGCEEEKTDSELVNGECPLHPGKALEHIKEENYFFKYSAFGEKLLAFYAEHPHFVVPDFRFNEVKSFIKGGLRDFPISRLKSKMPWGVPVPGDDEHVMYVWFDALTNYISTLGWPDESGNFKTYWKDGNPTQYCGKDNTRFQAAMWQAMLMAAELPNSHQIIVNGHITAEGGVKMSKSLGNVINPKDIVAEYGTDALRFFLAKEINTFEDSPFTIERFKDAYNAGLANGLGNLVSRILTMAENYKISNIALASSTITDTDLEVFDIKKYMDSIWLMIKELDKEIQEKEPYKLFKINPEIAIEIVNNLCGNLSLIANRLLPVMPETAQKILDCLLQMKKPEQPLFMRKD
jgi:methionyl-tRNA synthetase